MDEMKKTFLPRVNDFSEKLKELQRIHFKHIIDMSEQQKLFREELQDMKRDLAIEGKKQELNNNSIKQNTAYIELENKLITFEKHIKAFRLVYQQYINDTNQMLGKVSNHWGGYIEQVGVEYMLNFLRKEYGVHTWYQKYKQYWHKSKNVEIDLVAVSDTHAYIIEVKNQLKPEVIKQIYTSLDKINDNVKELKHLKKQLVLLCVHADIELLKTLNCENVWVLKYAGFEDESQKYKWFWLQGEIEDE